ncbi:MAG: putative lipase [Nocardioidaceae bacterium]|nr:putative lipase [Nocardioidaceae bacterium]
MKQGATLVDALALASATVDDLLVATTRDTHLAIARRTHGLLRRGLGPAGQPVQALHEGIASLVYAAVGGTLRGTSIGLGALAASRRGPRLEEGRRGRALSSAVNGLIGEELRQDRPELAIEMAVRQHGGDVPVTATALDAAFPEASGQVVVFLHGLCENEEHWDRHRDRVGSTYGQMLTERGWTPVFLRANTGLPLRENGVALACLMQQLVEAWPVEVTRIALVGHSLGGLVMRAAASVVTDGAAPSPWTERVSEVITLGTPHLGSWFALSADHASRVLARAPEVAAFGRIIDRQAPGIHDLIEGLAHDVPALPHANYRLVSASLTSSAQHPVAAMVGDLLVTPRSATGRDARGTDLFPGAETLHVGRTDHFGLLNHPDVHTALQRWLS